MRACIFCGERADSREHVIAKRLARRLGVEGESITVGSITESKGFQRRQPYPLVNLQCRAVCGACNSGWMNDLEAWLDDNFGLLFEPKWPPPPEAAAVARHLAADIPNLCKWMTKTAAMTEASGPLKGKVPSFLLKSLWERTDWSETHVMLGFIRVANLDISLEKGFRTWNGGVLQRNQEHRDGFSFGIQLNHVGLRILRCPGARPLMMRDAAHPETMPFRVTMGERGFRTVATHTYADMDTFYSSVVIDVTIGPRQ